MSFSVIRVRLVPKLISRLLRYMPTFLSSPDRFRAAPAALTVSFVASVLMQLLDWHSTFLALSQGRSELNPLILWVSQYVGVRWAVSGLKLVALPLTAAYYFDAVRKSIWILPSIFLAVTVVVYLPVVINNYS